MRTRTKVWLGIGTFAFAASADPDAGGRGDDQAWRLAPAAQAADAAGAGGEGGEGGGEGGEGGEGGLDPARAGSDPAEFLTALDVIAAHYHAGRDAYRAGDVEAGAEMFAHPIGEVYAELEPVFLERGVEGLGERLDRAARLGAERAPVAEVDKAVADVLASLAEAEGKAPGGGPSAGVRAAVMGEMIDRAALMYGAAAAEGEGAGEAYLDGYGFRLAAEARAAGVLPAVGGADAEAARAALATLAAAYPGPARPAPLPADAGEVMGAASRAKLALGSP